MKVSWADKVGYVFSGFLQRTDRRKVRFLIPNTGMSSGWECIQLPQDDTWEALVDTDTRNYTHSKNSGEYTSLSLKIGKKRSTLTCTSTGYLDSAVLNLPDAPFAVFSGFRLAKQVKNQVQDPIKLLPGEICSFSLYDPVRQKERKYLVVAKGTVFVNPNFAIDGRSDPIDSIWDYSVNLYSSEVTSQASGRIDALSFQKLDEGTVRKPGDTDTHEMNVLHIYFAGDLDGDNQLDLILRRWNVFRLYLSSKKLPGFLLRYVSQ
jgi:hypothetical protein